MVTGDRDRESGAALCRRPAVAQACADGANLGYVWAMTTTVRDTRPFSASRLLGWIAVVLWCTTSTLLVAVAPGRLVTELVVIPCVLFAPGTVAVRFLRLRGAALVSTVVLLVALATGVLVPSVFLYAGAWSPVGSFVTITSATILAACGGIVVDAIDLGGRSPRPPERSSRRGPQVDVGSTARRLDDEA
jgi:hypothetical protein